MLDIYLSTNGSLLKEKIVKELINSGLTRIQVSIDAFTKKTFDKIRQGGNFSEVVTNTINFLKIRKEMNMELPTLRVNFVRTNLNKHEYDNFVNFWSDKADCIGIQDLVDIMRPIKTKDKIKKFNCAQPYYHLTVRYDGTILPCCTFFAAKLPMSRLKTNKKISHEGNLHKIDYNKLLRNITDTWKSEELIKLRKLHKDGDYHPMMFVENVYPQLQIMMILHKIICEKIKYYCLYLHTPLEQIYRLINNLKNMRFQILIKL